MKKVFLHLYNYGNLTQIGSFKDAHHDAVKCMQYLNEELVTAHGDLPLNIFYFVTCYNPTTKNDLTQISYRSEDWRTFETWKYIRVLAEKKRADQQLHQL